MESHTLTDDDCKQSYLRARKTEFANPYCEELHARFAHLLPSERTSASCNAPGEMRGGVEVDRCAYIFKEGDVYVMNHQDGPDVTDRPITEVLLILGRIIMDHDGAITDPNDDRVVARSLASNIPARVGQLTFFAASSIKAHRLTKAATHV